MEVLGLLLEVEANASFRGGGPSVVTQKPHYFWVKQINSHKQEKLMNKHKSMNVAQLRLRGKW